MIALCYVSCAEQVHEPFEPSKGHISRSEPASDIDIPELVQQVPVVPEPEPPVEQEKYTVVVNEVPVKELLFALARDAQINVDIDPRIDGVVTINAVDQTLPQLLQRITRQVSLRYIYEQDNLTILPDEPFFRSYNVGYLNLSRDTTGSVSVTTQIASASSGDEGGGGGGGSNTSNTTIDSESSHQFWNNLAVSISAIIDPEGQGSADSNVVTVNPESGVVTVYATKSQHDQIQGLIDQVLESATRQVLIQATVVEVDLNDQYQSGIDWRIVQATDGNLDQEGAGFNVISTLLGNAGLPGPPNTLSSFILNYQNPNSQTERISATISLLSEFGNTRVMSSPQIMVLNNHTAVLKVVENFVYFEIEQEIEPGDDNRDPTVATTTTARTVPIGLVLTVTPQISKDDSVTLNIRPTISSVVRTEADPNPNLLTARPNLVPVVRVREMESILRINSNQIAVLGGLMQDTSRNSDRQTPGAADIPLLGELFKSKNRESLKTELVIFLRPVVIKNASLDGDLSPYNRYLTTPN